MITIIIWDNDDLALCIITAMSHEHHGVSNHWPLDCFFNSLFRVTSKKTSKPLLLVLCEGNPPVTGGFPSQRASNMESVSMLWHHHDKHLKCDCWQPRHILSCSIDSDVCHFLVLSILTIHSTIIYLCPWSRHDFLGTNVRYQDLRFTSR